MLNIYKIKADQARVKGENLINTIDMARDYEVNSLAAICLWVRDQRSLNFFAFNRITYHLVARCCEGAAQWKNTF